MKKIIALILSLVMVFSLSVTAFATNSDGESYTKGSIEIKNPQAGIDYNAYKIFDVTYDLGSDGTSDDKYAYTIAPEWQNDVIAYTGATADENGVYTGKGLVLTPVKNTAGTVVEYNVTLVPDDPATTDVNEAIFSAADFGEAMAEKTTGKTGILFEDGKVEGLDLGYYMVQPTSANALVSLTTTDADVKVADKNEKPPVDKKIADEPKLLDCEKEEHTHNDDCYDDPADETTLKCTKQEHTHTDAECYVEKEYASRSVGDEVPFELDCKVPNMTGFETYFYVVNDTLSKGLTFNNDVEVKIGGKDKTQKTLTAGTDYTVKVTENEDGSTNVRIVFKDMKDNYGNDADSTKNWENEPIVITYSATVNQDAVMGTEGNKNTAFIEYSKDPNIVPEYVPGTPTDDDDPDDPQDPKYKHNSTETTDDDPTGKGPEDKVEIYTAELDLTKIDSATKDALTGAKFKIEGEKLNVVIVNKEIFEEDTNGTYYRLKDGTYTEAVPVGEGVDPVMTYAEKTDVVPVEFTELTGAQAVANEGLYYSVDNGVTKTLITADNKATVPTEAKIYQPTYNAVGLYVEGTTAGSYIKITEENAASYTADDTKFYVGTEHKQSDIYEDTTVKYKKVEVIEKSNSTGSEPYAVEGFVDENGKITFGGLEEGTYYITELVAPDGYNKLKNPIKVVVELVKSTADATNAYKFQIKIDDATTPVVENGGVVPFSVENSQGIELPETGGKGTVALIAVGAVLFVIAGIVLTTKKRLYNEG